MKILIKTIKGETFPIEVEGSETILGVKQKIQKEKGIDAGTQKLILKGAQTQDEQTLESLLVKDGDFMVVMSVKKPAGQPQAQPQSQPLSQSQPPIIQAQPSQPQQENKPAEQHAQQPRNLNPQPAQNSGMGMVQGEQYNQIVNDICGMGFPKEEVVRALRAAYNNPDRAVEYLINGNIPNLEEGPGPRGASGGVGAGASSLGASGSLGGPAHGQGGSAALGGAAGLGGAGGLAGASGLGESPLSFLNQHPMFQQLRRAVRANPNVLSQILPQLASSQPQLYQLITQNFDEFVRLLAEDDGAAGGQPSGPQVVQVTHEEKAAIDRLAGLGFSRQQAIEAFLACDKNEGLAANYLFDCMTRGEFNEPVERPAQNQGAHQQGAQPAQQQPQQGAQPVQQQVPQNQGAAPQELAQQPQQQQQQQPQQPQNEGSNQNPSNQGGKPADDDDNIFS